jgi:hypothetical protein
VILDCSDAYLFYSQAITGVDFLANQPRPPAIGTCNTSAPRMITKTKAKRPKELGKSSIDRDEKHLDDVILDELEDVLGVGA